MKKKGGNQNANANLSKVTGKFPSTKGERPDMAVGGVKLPNTGGGKGKGKGGGAGKPGSVRMGGKK